MELNKIEDKFIHLEDIESENNLEWVKSENLITHDKISQMDHFQALFDDTLNILNDDEKIPRITFDNEFVYNFWQDSNHVRGLWRRTTLEDYKTKNPKWDILLDIDQLAKDENKNWVFQWASHLETNSSLALVHLSNGGKDASEIREFNKSKKQFIKDGFNFPEAKNWSDWKDENTMFAATDFGTDSLTDSGYPRIVKLLKRGQKLEEATLIAEVSKEDTAIYAKEYNTKTKSYSILTKWLNFYEYNYFFIKGDQTYPINVPKKSLILDITDQHLFIKLNESWHINGKNIKEDSILAIKIISDINFQLDYENTVTVYSPEVGCSTLHIDSTKDFIVINELKNIKGHIVFFNKHNTDNFKLTNTSLDITQDISLDYCDCKTNRFTYTTENFNSPKIYSLYDIDLSSFDPLRSNKEHFSSSDIEVKQQWVASADGTQVPYFLVGKKSVLAQGPAPTELYGYGGFNVTLKPSYGSVRGKLWLEKGGVFALANIRGGGEFGQNWHQSAILKNKQKSYDDFIAIAEDLIEKNITNSQKLSIYGGSNGGLLVGAVMTQRPDLFALVNCSVPLLDMMRYHKLLAGASWVAEYGDPDSKEDQNNILKYSPYQNLKENTKYPTTFFYTSTKDDRVHPGHARKMVAKMKSMNIPNVYYYENINGGHAGSSNNKELAYREASRYALMWDVLQ